MTEWRDRILHSLRHPDALPLPFSLRYNDTLLQDMLGEIDRELLSDRLRLITPDDRLRISCVFRLFKDFPAAEWQLELKNISDDDTGIIHDLQSVDLRFAARTYALHRTRGAIPDPAGYGMTSVQGEHQVVMGAKGGRSNAAELPFFRIDLDDGNLFTAIGWSGQWRATVDWSAVNHELRIRAGLQYARFYLRPGESVTLPRILILFHEGDPMASNSMFRRLLRARYIPKYRERQSEPIAYCNTAFTREGYWRNECHAENQMDLIRALAELKPATVVTGQGWQKGGWPHGAGTWDADPEKYPDGVSPLAKAAADVETTYGLTFEPERAAPDTELFRDHPEWVLLPGNARSESSWTGHGLVDLAAKGAREYLLDRITQFAGLTGLGSYRHEFHLSPLQHWLDHDEPDRTGLTEIKYINGLYSFLDELAACWPESLRINGCAHRIDLEMIRRFHLHLKSDYWFDNVADQASLFALSQYLPNAIISTPLARVDDTSLHSTAASSLCLGWDAVDQHFDFDQAGELLTKYRRLRHLFNCDWYPLTRYDRSEHNWFGSQYHDHENGEGVLLMFRREDCPYDSRIVMLHGLAARTEYELLCFTTGHRDVLTGEELMDCYMLTLPERGMATMIYYRPSPAGF